MQAFLDKINGWKTYIGAIGMAAMGIFQLTQAWPPGPGSLHALSLGWASLCGAMVAAGLRHAVAKGI